MTFLFDLISNSTMPDRFKQTLLADMKFIQEVSLNGIKQVLLFGSLARRKITCHSDIDLCLVFEDTVNLESYEMRVFRGTLCGMEALVDTDVVMVHEKQLSSNSCRLYQEINKDKVVLAY